MRITKQRQIILEQLKKHHDHPSADIIYDEVRKVLPRVSLGTIYRNLEIMSEAGIILKIEQGGGQKRFDPNPKVHPHFRCTNCGAIEDVDIDINFPKIMTNESHRRVDGANLEFFGFCESCIIEED